MRMSPSSGLTDGVEPRPGRVAEAITATLETASIESLRAAVAGVLDQLEASASGPCEASAIVLVLGGALGVGDEEQEDASALFDACQFLEYWAKGGLSGVRDAQLEGWCISMGVRPVERQRIVRRLRDIRQALREPDPA